MYSFLFCSSPDHAGVQRRLQAAGETVFRMMPVVETTVAYHITMLRDDIGWCIIGPETPQPRPYVSEHVEDDVAVLVFGVPSDGSPQTMAEIVGEAWKKGKAPSVKRLDHSFSAIIVDRTVRAVHLISDQLGLHSVEYYIEARQLWVSPHDIPLVAGSPCRLDINLLAVYSVLRIGWSLMGAPFLSDLSITDPRVSYTWKDGAMTTTKNHFFESYERIRATDTQAKKALVDEMIAHLDTLTQKITTGQESVITDLTAGWDTRTVAALVMHNAPHRKIYALTHGGNSSLEYRTARWFADHYHIEHLQSLPSVSSPERVQHQLSAHAFYTNGQGSCFRIFSTGSVKTNAIIPHFTGHDAGYHKGLYYPNKFVTDPGAGERLVPENILMRGVFVGIAFHPVTALEHDLKQVLKGIIGECRELSPNTHDILDLFSIYERIGRYSPIDTSLKFPTANNRYCVFESPELIRIASRMPAPIAQNTILLREVLKRYATRSLYRLINNKIFAPALFNRHVARLMKMALEARARTLAALKIPAPSAGELKAQTEITQLLHRTAMEVAASAEQLIPVADNGQSIQTSLLPLPAHIKRKFFYGHVITFTRWHEQILEARRIGLR